MTNAMKREIAERSGRDAERRAARWLEEAGFTIVAERVRSPMGEIDLIARQPGLVVFAEVKWRRKPADLANAIDEHRLARVAAAVECVGHEYATGGEDMRIDVLLLAPGAPPRHIVNAWQP